jgi:hypothetical protein
MRCAWLMPQRFLRGKQTDWSRSWSGKRLGGASADAQSYNRCAESASLFSARLPDLTFLFELV